MPKNEIPDSDAIMLLISLVEMLNFLRNWPFRGSESQFFLRTLPVTVTDGAFPTPGLEFRVRKSEITTGGIVNTTKFRAKFRETENRKHYLISKRISRKSGPPQIEHG